MSDETKRWRELAQSIELDDPGPSDATVVAALRAAADKVEELEAQEALHRQMIASACAATEHQTSRLDAERAAHAETKAELAELRSGYRALDENGSHVHEAAMSAIRSAMGKPDATVTEMCAELARRKGG
jgi:hypothetical protein